MGPLSGRKKSRDLAALLIQPEMPDNKAEEEGGVVVKGGGGGAPLFRLQRRREAMKRDLSIRINPQCVWEEEGAKTKAGGRGNRG